MADLYAQVILPVPIAGTFSYTVPAELASAVEVGKRVLVQFGARHMYTGIVYSVSPVAPAANVKLKPVLQVLDTKPVVQGIQIRFWEWMAEYYLCTLGEVFKAALPGGMKVESETRLSLNPDLEPEEFAGTNETEQAVLAILRSEGNMTLAALEKKLNVKSAATTVSRLIDRGLLAVQEKLVERFRSVRKPYVEPTFPRHDPSAMAAAFSAVKRSPKQEEALTALIALSEFARQGELVEVPLEVLAERTGLTRPVFKALEEKGLCRIYNKEISRFSPTGIKPLPLPQLSKPQQAAYAGIMDAFSQKDVVLLHGVTASGKTEVYIHLIDYVLKNGKQALFLVPEIALTTQLTRRLQAVFGDKLVVYHSKFSDNERVEIYRNLASNSEPVVVIGARSAVFLPFHRLGLVIVDEEHESSYKQYDPAPRYNGRDAATVLARLFKAKTLFGSATPAVETYYKALSGKFGLGSLTERYTSVPLPAMEIVDMRAERRQKTVTGYFSKRLLDAAYDVTGRKKQVILFHNRRGYAPMARCSLCDFTPHCDYCDVSMTYHRRTDTLQCHYCGAERAVPRLCPQCGEPSMEIVGYGTERLEEEIATCFRNNTVLRMDLDTTRDKEGYAKIIERFSQGKADILVGTQMVTKGLDFAGVELVGVLSADSLINFPDFRSAERAFNMIEQVAGRAGRRSGDGKVLIQTYTPEHPILAFAVCHDYLGFYNHELEERRAFMFPPFSRIINIYLKHRDPKIVQECAMNFVRSLREVFGNRVHGPQEPPVGRVQGLYIRKIMLKVETGLAMGNIKEILRARYVNLTASPLSKGLTVYYDVDPV
ncbi:MAG: primosomal protein N' [Muribaculaceae bacterium]|nr:primosomal protein N' [Muribaculaceae bacterium]